MLCVCIFKIALAGSSSDFICRRLPGWLSRTADDWARIRHSIILFILLPLFLYFISEYAWIFFYTFIAVAVDFPFFRSKLFERFLNIRSLPFPETPKDFTAESVAVRARQELKSGPIFEVERSGHERPADIFIGDADAQICRLHRSGE